MNIIKKINGEIIAESTTLNFIELVEKNKFRLEGADLQGADLTGANLDGANLDGAKLPESIAELLSNYDG